MPVSSSSSSGQPPSPYLEQVGSPPFDMVEIPENDKNIPRDKCEVEEEEVVGKREVEEKEIDDNPNKEEPNPPKPKNSLDAIKQYGFEIQNIVKDHRSGFSYTASIKLANRKIYYIDMTEKVAGSDEAAREYLEKNAAKILSIGIQNGVGLGGEEKEIFFNGQEEEMHYFSANISSTKYEFCTRDNQLEQDLAAYFSGEDSEHEILIDKLRRAVSRQKGRSKPSYLPIFKDCCRKKQKVEEITECEELKKLINRAAWIVEAEKIQDLKYSIDQIPSVVESSRQSSEPNKEEVEGEKKEEVEGEKKEEVEKQEVTTVSRRAGMGAGRMVRHIVNAPGQCAEYVSNDLASDTSGLAGAGISTIVNGGHTLGTTIGESLLTAGEGTVAGLSSAGESVAEGLNSAGESVVEGLNSAGESVVNGVSSAGKGISAVGESIAESGSDFVRGVQAGYDEEA